MAGKVKISAFISGGLMGSDPWDASSFSGSSVSLFTALQDEGVLARAFGLDISRPAFMMRAAPRWHPDKEVWRRRVFQSRSYRDALTRELRRNAQQDDAGTVVLQLGAYADGPAVYAGVAPVMTYQDGIGAEYWLSPYAPAAITRDARLRQEHWSFEMGVAKGAARVLTSSDNTRRSFIENYGVAPERAVNVGIGCNIAAPESLPAKDYARPEILFIGKEYERKGGDLVASAFAEVKRRVPQAVLHVIGPTSRPPALPDSPDIVFHGFLSKGDPEQARAFYELLRRAALSVLPSRYEPAGLAPLEAMSFGVPAIVTNDWALKENIEHGETGFLLADLEPSTIAATIVDALSDQGRLARMSQAAYAKTPDRFSWKGVAQRIIACAEQARAEWRPA